MKPPFLKAISAALIAGLLLAACGGGESEPAAPPSAGGSSGTASLSWLPPTQNTDGSPVNLAGYRVYVGTTANSLSLVATLANPGTTSHVVANLASGTHYFALSAYASNGAESDRTAVVSKTIP